MAKKFGTVIVFKEGTTRAQAEAALKVIRNLSAVEIHDWVAYDGTPVSHPMLNEYESQHGSPVFYIP